MISIKTSSPLIFILVLHSSSSSPSLRSVLSQKPNLSFHLDFNHLDHQRRGCRLIQILMRWSVRIWWSGDPSIPSIQWTHRHRLSQFFDDELHDAWMGVEELDDGFEDDVPLQPQSWNSNRILSIGLAWVESHTWTSPCCTQSTLDLERDLPRPSKVYITTPWSNLWRLGENRSVKGWSAWSLVVVDHHLD